MDYEGVGGGHVDGGEEDEVIGEGPDPWTPRLGRVNLYDMWRSKVEL